MEWEGNVPHPKLKSGCATATARRPADKMLHAEMAPSKIDEKAQYSYSDFR